MYICFMDESTQLFKGSLSTIILKLLTDSKKMYGYEISKKVKEITAEKINLTEGALYPALHKLEAEGLLSVSIENVGNRQRKYYSLTVKGKSDFKEKLKLFNEFFGQMNQILKLKPNF